MTGQRTQAERALAIVIHEIREDWDVAGIVVALRHLSDQPMADVTAAALYCATKRTDQRTPDCIRRPGEHERALANLTSQRDQPKPSYLSTARCDRHGETLPCLHCQREAAGPPADPTTIRAIRAQYATPKETQ